MSANLLSVVSGYNQNCQSAVLTPAQGKQLQIYSARVLNNSGSAVDAAIGKLLALTSWKFGTIVVGSTPNFTDFTQAIQGGGTENLFDTTNNDGFLVGASVPFGIVGVNVVQGDAGSPVYAVKYFNGTSYVALTANAVPTSFAAGVNLIVFAPPVDWVPGTTVTVGGDATKYNIIVQATTAPSQAVTANACWVVQILEYQAGLADKTAMEIKFSPDSTLPLILSATEGLIPYFGGTKNAKNVMRALYSVLG